MRNRLLNNPSNSKDSIHLITTLTERWFAYLLIAAIPLIFSIHFRRAEYLSYILDIMLLLLTLVDAFAIIRPSQINIIREVEPTLSIGLTAEVKLHIRNPGNRGYHLLIRDYPPKELSQDFIQEMVYLPPNQMVTVTYEVTPSQRGCFEFGDIWGKIPGPLRFLQIQFRLTARQSVKVYPSLADTSKFNLMARRGRLHDIGIRSSHMAGAGREFESLRDYLPDDEYRRIDWKATAKRGKLISRQYEADRSQNVILVIDAGRTMYANIDGQPKIEHAIKAALMLAYVASLSDDRVGLLVFADTVQTWIPPNKGRGQVYRMMEALYDLKAKRAEADYRGAFAYMSSRWRRRSLMVCFTDLWDPDSSRQTMEELISLRTRHLIVSVTLMDTRILRLSRQPIHASRDSYEKAVAMQALDDRKLVAMELQHKGVLVVDSPADQLNAALVNRYLEIKERMLL